jgi:hypothetical protein
MHLIAPTFPELIQSLQSAGFFTPVFRRSPFKQAGMWRCEVMP